MNLDDICTDPYELLRRYGPLIEAMTKIRDANVANGIVVHPDCDFEVPVNLDDEPDREDDD